MKTYEDVLKAHGWRPGLWQDAFSKTFILDQKSEYRKQKRIAKRNKKNKRSK